MVTRDELEEIKKELDKFSAPVGRCWVCNVPVYAMAEDAKPICLECWAMQNEFQRITNEEMRTVIWKEVEDLSGKPSQHSQPPDSGLR